MGEDKHLSIAYKIGYFMGYTIVSLLGVLTIAAIVALIYKIITWIF